VLEKNRVVFRLLALLLLGSVVFTKHPSNLILGSATETLAEASFELESDGTTADEFDGVLVENHYNGTGHSITTNQPLDCISPVSSIFLSLLPSRAPPKLS
jgi:hypothetical protein